jgi:Uma2 family endonuclease
MPSAAPKLSAATVAELLAIPAAERFHEVIDGELVRKAMPSIRHGMAQMGIGDAIAGPYGPRARGRGPGGWVFASETEVAFEPSQVYRPDVSGWRRESLPELPRDVPISVRPDWVCEILSASNAHNDLVRKMRVYHQRSGVPYYWVLDPEAETLTVYRWMAEGYLVVQTAAGRELLRPEPFGEVELSVRGLIEGDE